MNLRTILFSQYPALFLLAVLFLIAHLRVRKTSAVKSVLWVILFGAALAASVVCCFLGIQAELWTLKTLITLGFWSWFGVGLVLLFLVLRVVHGVERKPLGKKPPVPRRKRLPRRTLRPGSLPRQRQTKPPKRQRRNNHGTDRIAARRLL